MASSQMPQPASMAIGGGGGRGGNRTRERDPHNPSAIARAGLGDGGGGGAGRGGGGVFTQGGKMFGWPRGVPRASALPLVSVHKVNIASLGCMAELQHNLAGRRQRPHLLTP